MPTTTNEGGIEGQQTAALPDQLDLSGLPLVFDSRSLYRPQVRNRPRLEDFLRHRNEATNVEPKWFHYPFHQTLPSLPQFGTPEFQTLNSKADASLLNEKSEHPLSIPIPPFLITIREQISRYIIEWWLLELLSWFIGALSVAALVIILNHYDGQPMPQWNFGLNALISLLAGITRSSLLVPTYGALGQLKWNWFRASPKLMVDFEIFDSASRGPLGSIFLLFRTYGRHISSLGCLVVLASLPLSLSFQQTVAYPEHNITTDSNVPLPRVITYGNSDIPFTVNGSMALDEDILLESAVNPFLYGNGTDITFDVFCPTGNCTWDSFESLAVCGSCTDVSYLLTYACISAPGDWLSNVTTVAVDLAGLPPVQACGYYINATEDRPFLMTGFENGANGPGEALSMRLLPLTDTITRTPLYGTGSIKYNTIRNPIADFIVAGTAGDSSNVYTNSSPVANECVLHWCTQTFTPTYEWGQINENPSNVFYDSGQQVNPWQSFRTSSGAIGAEYIANFSLTPPIQHPPSPVITYGLSNTTALQVLFLFDAILPSYLTSNVTTSQSFRYFNTLDDEGPRVRSFTFNPWLPPNNVSAHIGRLANAMTHSLRVNSNETNIIFGKAYVQQTFVKVRWGWVSLPVFLLIMSFIFLVATIAKSTSEQHEVGIWKNSALAVLLNGLDEPLQRRVGPLRKMGDVRSVASKWRVKIFPD